MLRIGLVGRHGHLCLSKHHSRTIHLTNLVRFRVGNILRVQEPKNHKTNGSISDEERKAESKLNQNEHFRQLSEDFSSHDHIHLRESETEQNDSLILGSMHHRKVHPAQTHNTTFSHSHSNSPSKSPSPSQSQTQSQSQSKSKSQIQSEPHEHPHSHSHSHSHSHAAINPMLVMSKEQVKRNPGVRITWIGLAINVGLAVGKFTGGFVFHSQALIADAVHAVSDMVSDFLTLISVGLASNKPTSDYPFGYGKVETIGSLAVSTILATAGLSIGWTSLCAIVGPVVPHAVLETLASLMGESHSHSHSITKEVTNANAAWIAGASIIVKEWIFQATKKIAIQTNSNVLMANAWHHRVDSLTSLVALVTITSGYLFNVQSLDAVGGLIVSGLVIKAGAEGMWSSVKELADQSLPKDDDRYLEVENALKESLAKLVSNNNAGRPYCIRELTVLPSGPNVRANLILETPLQKWDNVLDIKEFEIVSYHLRMILYKQIPALKRLNIEFVEEIPDDTTDETDETPNEGHCSSESEKGDQSVDTGCLKPNSHRLSNAQQEVKDGR